MKIQDTLDCIIDNRGKTPPIVEDGRCLLEINCIASKGKFPDYSVVKKYVSEETYSSWFRSGHPNSGDILIPTVGTLDAIGFMDRDDCCIAQNLIALRTKKNVCNSEYLFYLLCDPIIRKRLLNLDIGGVQPSIKVPHLKNLEVDIPSIEVQNKVASVLHILDQKISINEAINRNLMNQLNSLYKSWFIDFSPFGGEAPTEWKQGVLKDILELKKDAIKAGENSELSYLPIDSIPMNDLSVSEVKPSAEAQSSLILFRQNDILIGAMRVYFHRVVIAPFDGITRTTCFVLRPYDEEYLGFGLLCCNQKSSIDFAQATSKGSTMPYAVWDNGLGDMEINIPDRKTATDFNEIVKPMLEIIQMSFFKNQRLREIRDSFLPKLMSGELDVSDLDI